MLKYENLMHNPGGLKEQARQKEIEHLDRSEGLAQAIESKMVCPKALPISKITNRKSSMNECLSHAFEQLLKPIFRHATRGWLPEFSSDLSRRSGPDTIPEGCQPLAGG